MKKRYRIKSQLRFTIFLSMVILIAVTSVFTIMGQNQAEAMTKPVYTEVLIQNGDTLWQLAKTYGPADEDIRKVIYKICEINGITADHLQSGQSILIPKYL